MKKMYKAMLLVLCAVLLVAGSVMGTLAYLKAQTGTVTNAMTVGKVEITLDEAKVNVYGEKLAKDDSVWETGKELADRVADGNKYKLIPGHTYTKDPKITVSSGSEKCWVFVKLENGLNDTATFDIDNSKWTIVATYTDHSKVYAYNTVLKAGDDATLFTEFTFAQSADPETYNDATIQVTGYAVQADGFGSAEAAWAASGFGTTNSNP